MVHPLDSNHNGQISTTEHDMIQIMWWNDRVDGDLMSIVLPRQSARMLAKRLNQCLDSTNKK